MNQRNIKIWVTKFIMDFKILLVLFRDCWNVCRISSFHTVKCKEGPNCRFSIQLGFRELEVLNLSQTLHLFYIQVTIIEFFKDIINLNLWTKIIDNEVLWIHFLHYNFKNMTQTWFSEKIYCILFLKSISNFGKYELVKFVNKMFHIYFWLKNIH